VVVQHYFINGFRDVREATKYFYSVDWVSRYDRPLFLLERTGLEKDFFRNEILADVVQIGAEFDFIQSCRGYCLNACSRKRPGQPGCSMTMRMNMSEPLGLNVLPERCERKH
jgi:hypothetical protein